MFLFTAEALSTQRTFIIISQERLEPRTSVDNKYRGQDEAQLVKPDLPLFTIHY
jgi:hypothetical protein